MTYRWAAAAKMPLKIQQNEQVGDNDRQRGQVGRFGAVYQVASAY